MAENMEQWLRRANDEIIDNGNMDAVDEVFTTDYVAHAGSKTGKGHAFVRKFIGQIRAAIPDVRVVKVEVLTKAGDTIAWQRTLSGTHEADMMGIPPTGKKVTWTEMVVSRFDGDKIAEDWVVTDLAGQLFAGQPRA
jgi:predicted ester cyclase